MMASTLTWCGLPLALLAFARVPCARAAHGPRALEASILGGEDIGGNDYSLEGDRWAEEDYLKRRHRSHHTVAVQAKGQLQGSIAQEPSSGKAVSGHAGNSSAAAAASTHGQSLAGGNVNSGNASADDTDAGSASLGNASNASNASSSDDDNSVLDTRVLDDDEVRDIEHAEEEVAHEVTFPRLLNSMWSFAFFWILGAAVVVYIHRQKYKASCGCASILCFFFCCPCGLLSLCCPMDEETPTMPILAPIMAGQPVAAPSADTATAAAPAQQTSAQPDQAKPVT